MAIQEIQVVFDTNSIFANSESYLLRLDVANIIKTISERRDLKIKWHLPEVVFHERRFQMQREAQKLLPSLRKFEKLFDLNLDITQSKINSHVNELAEQQRKGFLLEILSFDASHVDWHKLMLDAVYREPPFEPGDKEKGFRDALICETVIQLISKSSLLTILVAKDGYLKEAVNKRAQRAKAKNLKFLDTPEELNGFFLALLEGIDEEFILKLQRRAKAYFFEEGNKDTLFYCENIRGQIEARFEDKLRTFPEGSDSAARGDWNIQPPIFRWKERDRFYWITTINVEATAFKINYNYLRHYLTKPSEEIIAATQVLSGSTGEYLHQYQGRDIWVAGGPVKERSVVVASEPWQSMEIFAKGESIFRVSWNAIVTDKAELGSPEVENIEFVETSWR